MKYPYNVISMLNLPILSVSIEDFDDHDAPIFDYLNITDDNIKNMFIRAFRYNELVGDIAFDSNIIKPTFNLKWGTPAGNEIRQRVIYGDIEFNRIRHDITNKDITEYLTNQEINKLKKMCNSEIVTMFRFLMEIEWYTIFKTKTRCIEFIHQFCELGYYPIISPTTPDYVCEQILYERCSDIFGNDRQLNIQYSVLKDVLNMSYYQLCCHYIIYNEDLCTGIAIEELEKHVRDTFGKDILNIYIFSAYYYNHQSISAISRKYKMTTKDVKKMIDEIKTSILNSEWKHKYADYTIEKIKPEEQEPEEEQFTIYIDVLELPGTITKILKRNGLETVQDLLDYYVAHDETFTGIKGISEMRDDLIINAINDLSSKLGLIEDEDDNDEEEYATEEEVLGVLDSVYEETPDESAEDIKITELGMPSSVVNVLHREGLNTVIQLLEYYTDNNETFTNINGISELRNDIIITAINNFSAKLGITDDQIKEPKVKEEPPVVEPVKYVPKGYDDPRLVPDDTMVQKLNTYGILSIEDVSRYPRDYFMYIDGMTMDYINLIEYRMKEKGISYMDVNTYRESLMNRVPGMVTFYDLFVSGIITNASFSKLPTLEPIDYIKNKIIDRIPNITAEGVAEIKKVSDIFGISIYTSSTYGQYVKNTTPTEVTISMLVDYFFAQIDDDAIDPITEDITAININGKTLNTLADLQNLTYNDYLHIMEEYGINGTTKDHITSFFDKLLHGDLDYKFAIRINGDVDVSYQREISQDNGMLSRTGLSNPSYDEVVDYIMKKINIDYDKVGDEIDPSDIAKIFVDIVYYMPSIRESIMSPIPESPSFNKALNTITKSNIDVMSAITSYLSTLNGFNNVAMALLVKYIMCCKDFNTMDPFKNSIDNKDDGITFNM